MNRSTFPNYELERALFAPYSLSALLHTPKRLLPNNIYSNLLFTNTYKSWCSTNKCLNRDPAFSPFNTFWGNPCFTPGLENGQYTQWREKGISPKKDIFDPGGNVRSFAQLQEIHNLPNRDFFMFLQARHYAQSHPDHMIRAVSADIFLMHVANQKCLNYDSSIHI